MRIVGIDPSLSNFGVAYCAFDKATNTFSVDKLELTKTDNEKDKAVKKVVRKNSEDLERASKLHKAFQDAIAEADIVMVEVPVGSQSARAMASYGICLGVIASCHKPMIQVTPTEVKVTTVGKKTATKQEMIEWAYSKYPDANWLKAKRGGVMELVAANEHLADAIGAVVAGIQTTEFRTALSFSTRL